MNERVLHAAELWLHNKLDSEAFQLHADWYNWEYESKEYDINVFTDFHTGKTGATIYPAKSNNTHNGVRIL